MDDLIAWLRAVWDEDEGIMVDLIRQGERAYPTYPERIEEIDAKRRILALHVPRPTGPTWDPGPPQCSHCADQCHSRSGISCESPDAPYPCPTVRLLAAPYAGRPGWRQEWTADAPDGDSLRS